MFPVPSCRGAEGFIGIGYQTPDVSLGRLPGWEPHSYGCVGKAASLCMQVLWGGLHSQPPSVPLGTVGTVFPTAPVVTRPPSGTTATMVTALVARGAAPRTAPSSRQAT